MPNLIILNFMIALYNLKFSGIKQINFKLP